MPTLTAPKTIICILIIIAVIIASGILLGYLYSNLPGHHPQKNRQSCESAGGQWTDDQTCLISNKKAGEPCTNGAQCISGICFPPALTEEQQINLTLGPLKNIVGSCYPEDEAIGCVEQVQKGIITKESMCLED